MKRIFTGVMVVFLLIGLVGCFSAGAREKEKTVALTKDITLTVNYNLLPGVRDIKDSVTKVAREFVMKAENDYGIGLTFRVPESAIRSFPRHGPTLLLTSGENGGGRWLRLDVEEVYYSRGIFTIKGILAVSIKNISDCLTICRTMVGIPLFLKISGFTFTPVSIPLD